MNKTIIALAVFALLNQNQALASGFIITSDTTTAQTLSSSTGNVNSGKSLTVSESNVVAVTVTGNSTLSNNGVIKQTGTGRAIDLNTANVTLTINNNIGALIDSVGNDAICINKPTDIVILNN